MPLESSGGALHPGLTEALQDRDGEAAYELDVRYEESRGQPKCSNPLGRPCRLTWFMAFFDEREELFLDVYARPVTVVGR